MRVKDQVLRGLVFLVYGLETIASEQLASGEQLNRELGWGAAMIFGLLHPACVVPAFVTLGV
jgi:hypothetical protein